VRGWGGCHEGQDSGFIFIKTALKINDLGTVCFSPFYILIVFAYATLNFK